MHKQNNWYGFYGSAFDLLLMAKSEKIALEAVWSEIIKIIENNPEQESHCEFIAMAVLHLFDQDDSISDSVRDKLNQLYGYFKLNASTSNWRLMKRVVDKRLTSKLINIEDVKRCDILQRSDGFLPDAPKDESSQYHAYILLLILRFGDPNDLELNILINKGFIWLVRVYEKYGDPSPLGRGRFQIFGYSSMCAAGLLGKSRGFNIDEVWLASAHGMLSDKKGVGALSHIWEGPHKNNLLYGYNTVNDYPCFSRLWLFGLNYSNDAKINKVKLGWVLVPLCGGFSLSFNGVPIFSLINNNDELSSDVGYRKILGALKNKIYSKTEGIYPVVIEKSRKYYSNGCEVICNNDCMEISLQDDYVREKKVISNVVFWVDSSVNHNIVRQGSVEICLQKWSNLDNINIWTGYGIRVVRKGCFSLSICNII